MCKLRFALLAAAVITIPALGQTPAPAADKAPARTVKAIQPGLFEVASPRVNDVIAAQIQSITAEPGKGARSIHVHSMWGDSYYGWPKNVKPVFFTIEVGKPAGGATISAPGFTEANKSDYEAAIESIVPFAIASTHSSKAWRTDSENPRGDASVPN